MRKLFVMAAVLMLLILPTQAFSQSRNASLGGTITDASGGSLPGVVVTATNTDTKVVLTATSNNAGVYNLPSLPPGMYKVSAEMSGFQTYTYTDVTLGNAVQVRLNFTLEVRKLEQSVEVNAAADNMLLESSSSVGSVLQKQVSDLPLVTNNALDFVKVMGGAVIGMNPVWDAENSSFAGVRAANINVQRDGVTVDDVKYTTGINSPTRLNPDLIGEFRMLLSPIDAEIGRGNGQVQVMTRSGTNSYHGAAVFNVRNSALDSSTWYQNAYGVTPAYSNQPEYTISAGGPIIKNKTFFFVLWDQQLTLQRNAITPIVLTPCARKGIFRYFDNWNNGNATQPTTGGGTPTIAVVNRQGVITPPTVSPTGGSQSQALRYMSVFAPLANTPQAADCSDAVFQTGAGTWDGYRTAVDPTGFIGKFMNLMPTANNYTVGDGLNVAGFQWTRTLHGGSNLWEIGENNNRKQINVRIDHNINASHRLSGSWSYDRNWADDTYANWPTGYGGTNFSRPMVLTVNLTSALRPTLLNDVRFGMSRTGTNVLAAIYTPGSAGPLSQLFPNVNGLETLVGPGSGAVNFSIAAGATSHFMGTSGLLPVNDVDTSPRWTYGDTISWTKGRHAFRGGGEFRKSTSKELTKGSWAGYINNPTTVGGNTSFSNMAADWTNHPPPGVMAGVSGAFGNRLNAEGLANFLSGSMSSIRQYYYINSATQTTFSDPRKEPDQVRDLHQKEFDFFFKDDWKATDSLTLNLGVRYEYYGVPFVASGLTASLQGGSNSIFGPGLGWNNMEVPGAGNASFRTQLIFVGPNSPNPGISAFNGDRNNFGPAVGFAYQLPWFGKGKTTIRGGYQINYMPNGRLGDFASILGAPPLSTYLDAYNGSASQPYLDLTSLPSIVPVPIPAGIAPVAGTAVPGVLSIQDRTQAYTVVDNNLRSPYVQNVVMAVTRNLTSHMALDVRYIGTFSRKLSGALNINIPNFLTNGLLQALSAARAGGESTLLNQMFQNAGVPGYISGATTVRTSPLLSAPSIFFFSPASSYLANGDFASVANILSTTSAFCGYPGCLLDKAGLPQNFIKTNPQFNTASLYSNYGNSNYNGLQAQFTLRPTHGLSFQGTYTWSRNLGYDTNSGFTDPLNRRADYALLSMNRTQTFTTYGSWDLPFGPGKMLLKSSNGVVSRLVGGWQASWTGNVSTGMPQSFTAANMLYGRGVPNQVAPFDPKNWGVTWNPGAISGNYYGYRYAKGKDPQCTNSSIVATSLQASCTLSAIYVASSPGQPDLTQPVLVTPMPGQRGNMGLNNFNMPTTWNVDMAMSKAIRITESKSFSLRIDINNVFNHHVVSGWGDILTRRTTQQVDTAGPPDITLTSANQFGYLPAKVGARLFQAKLRFDF